MLSLVVPTGTSLTGHHTTVSPTCLSESEFLRRQFLEARDNSCASCDRERLQLHSAHPAHRVDALLEEEGVGLVVEA